MTADIYDVVVIGGGAAGIGGALTLVRARRSVLVIDAGLPRNAKADGVHMYPGQEGAPPALLLAKGRAEVEHYGGTFVTGSVVAAERSPEGNFRIAISDGTVIKAARVLVATGLEDVLPEIPGVAERWGRDVLHCPHCHGWEVRDQAVGILGTGPLAFDAALLWRQWSEDITLFLHTGPEPTDEEYEQLSARGIRVVPGCVTQVELTKDRLSGVSLDDGRTVPLQALVVIPRLAARTSGLSGLGLRLVEEEVAGYIVGTRLDADLVGATDVPGVWVAGNVTGLFDQVIAAAAAGVRVGKAINTDLVGEEIRRSVAARRPTSHPSIPSDT